VGNRKAPTPVPPGSIKPPPPPAPPKAHAPREAKHGTATLSVWLQTEMVEAEVGILSNVTGWLQVLTKEGLGFDPGGGNHARWVLAVYHDQGCTQLAALVPGCKVDGVLFHSPGEPVAHQLRATYKDDFTLAQASVGTRGWTIVANASQGEEPA
jgi:hypothetical protein